ncbi:hypothetical protein BGX21_009795 [Mortierella sp. AD011]|nr:hypothetical protein BGX20_000122 [Mortierella sp. AD010]KAF9395749.1 hypothetical protein BGX21_009795 [Mortierella sp. AD011]
MSLSLFESVFTIKELAYSILCYLDLDDISQLRTTSKLFHDVCTNPPCCWFYKALKSHKSDRGIPPEIATFVRSSTLVRPNKEMWDHADAVILMCPNLTELKYRAISLAGANEIDYETERFLPATPGCDTLRISSQVSAVASRLKLLNIIAYVERYRDFRSIDTLLLLMTFPPASATDNRQVFPHLLSLELMGIMEVSLEWSTLIMCLKQMPVLRELFLDLDLYDSRPDRMVEILSFQSQSLKLDIQRRGDKTASAAISNELEVLSVTNIVPLWTERPDEISTDTTHLGLAQVGSSSEREVTLRKAPFPELKKLSIANSSFAELRQIETVSALNRNTFQLPGNLQHLETTESRIHLLLEVPLDMALKHLSINLQSPKFVKEILTHSCCCSLTTLDLYEGVERFRDTLTEGSSSKATGPVVMDTLTLNSSTTDNATQVENSWEFDRLEESFVRSRLPFVSVLQLLSLNGTYDSAMPREKAMFLNKLLRCMPRLEDFLLKEPLDDIEVVFNRFGDGQAPMLTHLQELSITVVYPIGVELIDRQLRERFPSVKVVRIKFRDFQAWDGGFDDDDDSDDDEYDECSELQERW